MLKHVVKIINKLLLLSWIYRRPVIFGAITEKQKHKQIENRLYGKQKQPKVLSENEQKGNYQVQNLTTRLLFI